MRDGAYNPNLVVGYVCIIWKRVIFENSSVKYSWCVRRYYSDYIIFGCEICMVSKWFSCFTEIHKSGKYITNRELLTLLFIV